MCGINKQFVLCACEEKDLDKKNHWKIYRYDEKLEYWIGIVICEKQHKDFHSISAFILNELNSRNCFDKDINLNDHDALIIGLKEGNWKRLRHFAFSYENGTWKGSYYDMLNSLSRHVLTEMGNVKGRN